MANITHQKQMFENSVKTQIGKELNLTQSQSQQFCRENIELIHQMYEDGFSSADVSKQVIATVENIDALKDRLPTVFTGW